MQIQEHIPVGSKTTMRIGGTARWYAEIMTKEDAEQAAAFATDKKIPLIVLGGGSNTIFANEEVEALVVRIKADEVVTLPVATIRESSLRENHQRIVVHSGKILASLINDLAEQGLDLSPLTGIPGTLGGALFGNAGQGPKGVWLDSFVVDVMAYADGAWRTFTKEECEFGYRESIFKGMCHGEPVEPRHMPQGAALRQAQGDTSLCSPVIWEATLEVPPGNPETIKNNVETLLKKRFETQPHLKTAGSCFKAIGATPAWQLIDAAGLRGLRIGEIEISPKHANFLMNIGKGSYIDAKKIVETVKAKVPEPLEVEMRFIERDGTTAF